MDPRGGASTCPAVRRANPRSACLRPGSKSVCATTPPSAASPSSTPPTVLTTHLTEILKDNMAELLSYAETKKLLDDLPGQSSWSTISSRRRSPSQASSASCNRCLPNAFRSATCPPSSKASQKRLALVDDGERPSMSAPASPASSTPNTSPSGYLPLIALAADGSTPSPSPSSATATKSSLAWPSKLTSSSTLVRARFERQRTRASTRSF